MWPLGLTDIKSNQTLKGYTMAHVTKVVADGGDASVLVDNIGAPTPFTVMLTWRDGKLRVVVEQPKAGNPWPMHEFECDLIECSDEDEDG